MKAVFFPKSQHPVAICKHKDGKDVTITEQTDTLQLRYPIERYGFKRNIRTGAFLGKHYGSDSNDISTIDKMGNIRGDIYLHVGSVAPSYAGAMAIIQPWFFGMTGRKPSAVSFAGGNEGLAVNTINDFLGGRNSQIGKSQYGVFDGDYLGTPAEAFTRLNYSNLASTIRWSDDVPEPLTWEQVQDELEDVLSTEGWFRNFTHWHNLNPDRIGMQDEFYETMLNTLDINNKTAHFCSFGEALEYLTYRQLISRVHCYDSKNGNVRIAVEVKNLYLQDCINTPISVRIDLSGSVHSGKDFYSPNCEIIKLGTDDFIVNVPFRKAGAETHKVMLVDLMPTLTPSYKVFDLPAITTSVSGTTLTVTTNRPTYTTLFKKTTAQAEHQFGLDSRSMALKTVHTFNIVTSGVDYSVGVIDKFGNQALEDL